MRPEICRSIAERKRLSFVYSGKRRVVEPYAHGESTKGTPVLRAVQVGGEGSGFGFGKLWALEKMSDVRMTSETFAPVDPNYNPDDSGMRVIHCRVSR